MGYKLITGEIKTLCRGRTAQGERCLDEPVHVKAEIYQSPDTNTINTLVDCDYVCGGHGDRCKAPGEPTETEDPRGDCPCAFSFSIDE